MKFLKFPKLPEDQIANARSETAKYRHLTAEYCFQNDMPAVGVDIASQGDPVVPWAIQLDLPIEFSAAIRKTRFGRSKNGVDTGTIQNRNVARRRRICRF